MHVEPDERELDVIASTGEQVSVGLLALAIHAEGGKAVSLLGHQIRVLTDSAFARARIRDVEGQAIEEAFAQNKIAVIAGFQGVDDAGNITTLAAAARTPRRWPWQRRSRPTFVRFTPTSTASTPATPNVVPNARKVDRISYEEMLETGVVGRQSSADPVGRVRDEVRRSDSRPIEFQRQRRDVGRA